jgi:hypothetical protein
MANDYQINLTVKAISKFSDIEKQFKKSLNSLSKVAENTSKTLDKQTQKAFTSRVKQLKDLNEVEIKGLKRKSKLSENLLKNQNLNQTISNSLLQTKGNLELAIIEKKGKTEDTKNKKELASLEKRNKLIEGFLADKKLNKAISNSILKAKSITNAKKASLDIEKKTLDISGKILANEGKILANKGKILSNEKTALQAEQSKERDVYFKQQKRIRGVYAESRLYSDIGSASFYGGTLPALAGSILSVKNAMSIENETRSLSLYALSQTEEYDKLARQIAEKTSLDLPSSYSLVKSTITSAKSSGLMNLEQATKKIEDLAMLFSSFGVGREGTERLIEQYRQGVSRGFFSPVQDIRVMSASGLADIEKVYQEIFGKPIKGNVPFADMAKVLEKIGARPEVKEAFLLREKQLTGASDRLSTNILITSAAFGRFLDNTYLVADRMNKISNFLGKIEDRFNRLFTGKGTVGDKAMGGGIQLALTTLLIPIGMIGIGFIKRMYANFLASYFTKGNFKLTGNLLASIPLLVDFTAFTRVIEDFNKGGLLNALGSNIGTLGLSFFLLLTPVGRLTLLLKTLFEIINAETTKNWFEEKFFKAEIGGQATSMLGENSIKYLAKQWNLPEGTTKDSPAFQEMYFQKNKDIANPFGGAFFIDMAKAVEKGVIKGSEKSIDYSPDGKIPTTPPKTGKGDRNPNAKPFLDWMSAL